MPISDRDLVKLAVSGDHGAFHTLVNRYGDLVWHVAWRLTQSRDDEEEVFQDTFLRAWKYLPVFDGRSGFRTWLTRIALNCSLAVRRTRERQTFPRLFGRDVASPDPDPERLAISSEVGTRVVLTMGTMSEMERTAFFLHHFDGMPDKEIAAELGVTKAAARQAMYRAVRKLRLDLEPWDEVSPCI